MKDKQAYLKNNQIEFLWKTNIIIEIKNSNDGLNLKRKLDIGDKNMNRKIGLKKLSRMYNRETKQ